MRSPRKLKDGQIRKPAGKRRDLDSSAILFQDAIKEKGKHWSKLHLDEAYRLNALVGATEGFLDWNVASKQVLFSKKLKEMLGYEESEIGNALEEWTRRIHPDDLDMTLLAIDRHINGINKFYKKEHRIRCKIGNYKWIQNKGKVVERDKNGKALRFIVTVKDISHRKKAEIEYLERLKELNCHNQVSKILAISVKSASETLENIIHYIPTGFQYPDIAEASLVVYDQTFQTSQFKKTKYCLAENIVISEKIIGRIEVCYPEGKLPDNEVVFLREEVDLLFSIAERISKFIEKREKEIALKQSEETFRNLVETIHEIIYEVTADGVIKYLSPSIEKILGYKPAELIGNKIIEIVHPDDRENWTNKITSAGNPVSSLNEYRFLTKSGNIRWLSKSTATIHKEGLLISYVGSLTDITDRATQAKGELLSRMSLEIRTPLNAIHSFARLLEKGDLNSTQRKGVTRILQEVKHLEELVNEMNRKTL